jgi:hypothetical protein
MVAVVPQLLKSGPAFAAVGGGCTITDIWSLEVHVTLVIVHWNTYVPAVVIPLITAFGIEAVVIVAVSGPLTWDQEPVPTLGVLPVMVAEPLVEQMVWSAPAAAVVGVAMRVIVI